MNLFRQMVAPQAAPAPSRKLNFHFKLNGHAIAALGFLFFIGLGITVTFLGFRSRARELTQRQLQASSQLEQLMAETDTLADEAIRRKKAAAERGLAGKGAGKGATMDFGMPVGEPMDGSWTSLLWKLSAATSGGISVQQLDLTSNGGKIVLLVGAAHSLAALREWLERLNREIQGFDFGIDSQALTSDKKFPVQFRVGAKQL
jgi:hypothetical protein